MQLDRHGDALPTEVRKAIVDTDWFRRADVTNTADVAAVVAGNGPLAVYLALPPALFPHAISALKEVDLPQGSRIVLEKPFGEDMDSAVELNRMFRGSCPRTRLTTGDGPEPNSGCVTARRWGEIGRR